MTRAAVEVVEIVSIPGEELAHYGCPIRTILAQSFQESRPIAVISENIGFVDASHHEVVQSSGRIELGVACGNATPTNSSVQRYASTSPIFPDSAARDLKEKFRLYEGSGVLEYWVV